MSSERGNVHRHRAQKHKNQSAFKNTLHCNDRDKFINSLQAEGCCARCKDIIEWRIKYKKYKPLTQPKKCIKCGEKTVKRAYCVVCQPCAERHRVCMKCGKNDEVVTPLRMSQEEIVKKQAQLEQELKFLPERKRRTFLRLQASGKLNSSEESAATCRSEGDDGSLSDVSEDDRDEGTSHTGESEDEIQADNVTHKEDINNQSDRELQDFPENDHGDSVTNLEASVGELDI